MQQELFVVWHTPTGGVPSIIDGIAIDDKGNHHGLYSGETLEQLAVRYQNPLVSSVEDFITAQESALRTEPTRCTDEQYITALDMLPPQDWRRANGVESFKFLEHISGRMTRIYARKDAVFWTFVDRDDLSAEDIATKIKEIMK